MAATSNSNSKEVFAQAESAFEVLGHLLHSKLRQNAVLIKRERQPRLFSTTVHPPQHALLLDFEEHEDLHKKRLQTLLEDHVRPLVLWSQSQDLAPEQSRQLSRLLETIKALQKFHDSVLGPQLAVTVQTLSKRHSRLDPEITSVPSEKPAPKDQSTKSADGSSDNSQSVGVKASKPLLKKNGSVEVLIQKRRRASLGDAPSHHENLPSLLEIQQDDSTAMMIHSARPILQTTCEEGDEEEPGEHHEEARDSLGITKWGVVIEKRSPFEIRRAGSVERSRDQKRANLDTHPSDHVVTTLYEPQMPSLAVPIPSHSARRSNDHDEPMLTPNGTRRGSMPSLFEMEAPDDFKNAVTDDEPRPTIREDEMEEEEDAPAPAPVAPAPPKDHNHLEPPKKASHPPPANARPAGAIMELRKKGSVEQLMSKRRRESLGNEDPVPSARILNSMEESPAGNDLAEDEEEDEQDDQPTQLKSRTAQSEEDDAIQSRLENSPLGSVSTFDSPAQMDTFVLTEQPIAAPPPPPEAAVTEKPKRRNSLLQFTNRILSRKSQDTEDQENDRTNNKKQQQSDKMLRDFIKQETTAISRLYISNAKMFARYVEYTEAVVAALDTMEKIRDDWTKTQPNGKTMAELLLEPLNHVLYYHAFLEQLMQFKQGNVIKITGALTVVQKTCQSMQKTIPAH